MGWECSSEQSAYLALQEPQFRFDKLAAKKSKQKTKGHTTKKAFTKKTKFQKNYAILSYLVSQMFPFNIPLIKVSLKYVGEKGKEKKIRQFTWEAEASRTLSWKPDWPSQ